MTLTVYTPLGQQVAVLLEGEKDAGYHDVKFNAPGLASGLHLYHLTAGNSVQTRKLMVFR